jgi:outer membrane protein assembly factor BamB
VSDRALENASIQRRKIGEILTETGIVTEEEIQQIVREQIEEEIYDLFLWKKADFEFLEGPPSENLKDPDAHPMKLSFDVNGLLLEAVRRADEWTIINQTISSTESVFVFVSESDRHEEGKVANDTARNIHRFVDGRTSIFEIVENTGRPKFDVCKILVDLYSRGRVRLLAVQEQMDLAMEYMAQGRREQGLKMYMAAAAQAPDDARAVAQVAKFLEGEGLVKEAVGYHVKAGTLFLEQGDLDRALDHMQRAGNAAPEAPEVRMGMFEIHAVSGNLVEGKALARELVTTALMAPDLPLARKLCDRILKADPEDMDFRVLRAKTLHRANQRKDLEEDLAWIRQHMPVDPAEADRLQMELKDVLVKRATTAHVPAVAKNSAAPKAKGRRKVVVVGIVIVLLGVGGTVAKVEMDAMRDLAGTIDVARGHMDKFAFADARNRVGAFLEKTVSPVQKARAREFLGEIEGRRQSWEQDKQNAVERERQAALAGMGELLASVERERQKNPSLALQCARELRERAEANRNSEFLRRAGELIPAIEKHLGDALQLKLRADALEKEGKMREAAVLVESLLLNFPGTESARGALYPLDVVTRPTGVKVTNVRTGVVVGETPLLLRIRPGESVRLAFEKQGYAGMERDVKDKTVGRLQVDLQEKQDLWVFPIGETVESGPAILEDTLFVAGGSRLYALKASSKGLQWYEPLDGPVEGSPRVGNGKVYVATAGRSIFAIDPKASKRVAWKYDAGERSTGTPGLSGDGALLYAGTADRMLHVVRARTGEGAWKRNLPGEMRVEPLAAPGGAMIVACDDGTVLAIEGSRPEDEVWRFRVDGSVGAMILTEGVLYVTCSDQRLYAVDPAGGRRLWDAHLPSGIVGRPARVGSTLFAACRDGKVHFLDAATGKESGVFAAQGPMNGGLAASGTVVLFGSDDHWFYAFDSAARTLLWKLKSKGKIRTSAAVGSGAAYFGSDDSVYAVELN